MDNPRCRGSISVTGQLLPGRGCQTVNAFDGPGGPGHACKPYPRKVVVPETSSYAARVCKCASLLIPPSRLALGEKSLLNGAGTSLLFDLLYGIVTLFIACTFFSPTTGLSRHLTLFSDALYHLDITLEPQFHILSKFLQIR